MINTNISQNGYHNCIEISNGQTSVLLEPDCGGRVLNFSLEGKDIIYKNPAEDGYLLESGKPPHSNLSPCGGRCDIGPEMTTPAHPKLWLGKWDVRVIDDFTVEMISQRDENLGVQLTRTFKLNPTNAHLKFKQEIKNIGETTVNYFHWSRTFCKGGGIAIAPMNPHSRYPRGYITYGPGDMIDYMPKPEKNVVVKNGLLQIVGPPEKAKFAMDLSEGWLGYLHSVNILLIKTFKVYPHQPYGEIAANNMSLWYNARQMCEIEPIGPLELIQPGTFKSFTENWYLFNFKFSENNFANPTNLYAIISNL